jgi:hypothetical protein
MIADMFRGLHPRLFTLFAFGESRQYPSAKRMNMNSRGRQPTERRDETDSTLKGVAP